MYSLSYNALTKIKKINSDTHLTGSSKYSVINNKLIEKKNEKRHKLIEGVIYDNYMKGINILNCNNLALRAESFDVFGENGQLYKTNYEIYKSFYESNKDQNESDQQTYKLNKTKVRKKISALCRLNKAKNFVAFYSISFPAQALDNTLYEIFNSWLTNCRKRYGLETYLWVAERQGNGTLHFHLLTLNYMNIKEVNRAMAAAINTKVKEGKMKWGNSNFENYNGVDVDSPQRPKKRQNETRDHYRQRLQEAKHITQQKIIKWIGGYLTKYITKNDIKFTHLPFHCSRDVSALFTSKVIADNEIQDILKELPDEATKFKTIDNDEVTINIFLFTPDESLFKEVTEINEIIYNKFIELWKRKKTRLREKSQSQATGAGN